VHYNGKNSRKTYISNSLQYLSNVIFCRAGCSHFFSKPATYEINKSKWSTCYKNAKHLFIDKYIENFLQCMLYTLPTHTRPYCTTQLTMCSFCHYLTLHRWHALNGIWKVLMSSDLPTVPLRSAGRSRSRIDHPWCRGLKLHPT